MKMLKHQIVAACCLISGLMHGEDCERYWQQTNSAAANAVIARYAQERWLVKSATSPLHRAVINGNINDVVRLIDGARIPTELRDFQGRTPLFFAVFNRDVAMVCTLLNYNVDVLVRDEFEKTAFDYALKSDNKAIKELLRIATQEALVKQEAEMKRQAELKLQEVLLRQAVEKKRQAELKQQEALRRQQEAEMKQTHNEKTGIKGNVTEAELQDDFVIVTMVKKQIEPVTLLGGSFVMIESKS